MILEGNRIAFKSVEISPINTDSNRAKNLIELFRRMWLLGRKNRVLLERGGSLRWTVEGFMTSPEKNSIANPNATILRKYLKISFFELEVMLIV